MAPLRPRVWDAPVYLIGIDPGLAKIGLALVHRSDARRLVKVRLIETERNTKASKMTVAADNNMRFHEIHEAVTDFIADIPKGERVVVGIEAFAYTPGSGRNLLNTAQAVGVIKGTLFAMGKIPFEFQPNAVKKTLLGTNSGSKQDVQDALQRIYPDLLDHLGSYAKGKWEHLADAVALCECAFEEYAQRKLYLGAIG